MKIKDVLEKTTTFFKDEKIPSARLDADIDIVRPKSQKNRSLFKT